MESVLRTGCLQTQKEFPRVRFSRFWLICSNLYGNKYGSLVFGLFVSIVSGYIDRRWLYL